VPAATLCRPMIGDPQKRDEPQEPGAPAELARLSPPPVDALVKLSTLLEAMPVSAVLLDRDRRIIAANHRMIREFGGSMLQSLRGRRLGEPLGCSRAASSAAGCGSTPGCAWCGAFKAISEAQRIGSSVTTEWSVPVLPDRSSAIDIEVLATPIVVQGQPMSIVTLRDIGAEKRRRVLERIFFHDVLNTAGAILGIAHLLAEPADACSDPDLLRLLLPLSEQLVEEINSQRQLMAAETGELKVNLSQVAVRDLAQNLRTTWASSPLGQTRSVVLGDLPDTAIDTDIALLRRILGNMLKNALEATDDGSTITLSAEDLGESIVFAVHNPGVVSEQARHQIFLRSFSTKGEGRGIGTYSIRLLGEKYLRGKVDFSSSESSGTTFTILLPKSWPSLGQPSTDRPRAG